MRRRFRNASRSNGPAGRARARRATGTARCSSSCFSRVALEEPPSSGPFSSRGSPTQRTLPAILPFELLDVGLAFRLDPQHRARAPARPSRPSTPSGPPTAGTAAARRRAPSSARSDQPRPNGQLSRWAFARPHVSSCCRAQSAACLYCGEPVSRGPWTSVSCPAVSITCERRKPSSRMRPIAAQSSFSSANAGASGGAREGEGQDESSTRFSWSPPRLRVGPSRWAARIITPRWRASRARARRAPAPASASTRVVELAVDGAERQQTARAAAAAGPGRATPRQAHSGGDERNGDVRRGKGRAPRGAALEQALRESRDRDRRGGVRGGRERGSAGPRRGTRGKRCSTRRTSTIIASRASRRRRTAAGQPKAERRAREDGVVREIRAVHQRAPGGRREAPDPGGRGLAAEQRLLPALHERVVRRPRAPRSRARRPCRAPP